MAIGLTVNLERTAADLITGYGAGAKLYVYSASSQDGLYSAVTSAALVSGTEQYEFWDAAGTTATWYKTRVGNSAGTSYSDYSDAFQAGSLRAYATIDDLVETMSVPSGATGARNLLADLLVDASAWITERCCRSFFRSPQVSGTETRLFHVVNRGKRSLADALGYGIDIVAGSIVSIEIADQTGGSFTTIAAGSTGYWTEPQNPATGWPVEDVLLSSLASQYPAYPVGDQTVRIVAAFGWPSVPALVKRATVDLAREWYRQGPGGGGPIGVGVLGQPVFGSGIPSSVRQLLDSDYHRRDFLHV